MLKSAPMRKRRKNNILPKLPNSPTSPRVMQTRPWQFMGGASRADNLDCGRLVDITPQFAASLRHTRGLNDEAGSWENIDYGRQIDLGSQFAAPRLGTPIPTLDPSTPLDPTARTIEPTGNIPIDFDIKPVSAVEPEVQLEAEPKLVTLASPDTP